MCIRDSTESARKIQTVDVHLLPSYRVRGLAPENFSKIGAHLRILGAKYAFMGFEAVISENV